VPVDVVGNVNVPFIVVELEVAPPAKSIGILLCTDHVPIFEDIDAELIVLVEQEELGAYESTTVNISFDPAVHKDNTDLGELTRTIYVDTDNPNFPQLTSTITANVVKN